MLKKFSGASGATGTLPAHVVLNFRVRSFENYSGLRAFDGPQPSADEINPG